MSARRQPSAALLIHAPSEYGSHYFEVDLKELQNFEADAEGYVAKLYGVSREHYTSWLEDNCTVFCAAITARGKRCRNGVVGGYSVNPRVYVEMQGHYCERHGGQSRADVDDAARAASRRPE